MASCTIASTVDSSELSTMIRGGVVLALLVELLRADADGFCFCARCACSMAGGAKETHVANTSAARAHRCIRAKENCMRCLDCEPKSTRRARWKPVTQVSSCYNGPVKRA